MGLTALSTHQENKTVERTSTVTLHLSDFIEHKRYQSLRCLKSRNKLKNGLRTQKWATDPCGPTFWGGALLHPILLFLGPGELPKGGPKVYRNYST